VQTVRPRRLRLLFALFAVASLLLAGRLAYWQTFGRTELLARATDQVRSDLVVAAQRGVIRDRNGAILATTVELRSLYAIPSRIPDTALAARQLGVFLGRDPAPIRAALESGVEWLYVQRWLPEDTANAIAALKIPGLGFQNEPKRLYPNDAIGAAVLGFVNDDGDGVNGIEGFYDATLRGTDGRLVVERDPANRDLAIGLREAVAPRNGADLVLTIDLVAQTAAERELGAAMKKEHAASGSILVVDPSDGSIRALASAPTYDPAAVRIADPEALRDRAIAWPYEPGSTMKALTIAAALNEHLVTPSDWYNDVGYTIVGGRRLTNALGTA
jgi:cell division protein FtsI/penicillin-binding protein 2